MAKPTSNLSLEEMFRKAADGIRKQAISPNIYAYVPHEKQTIFHKSQRKKRLYIGGNRSGKTYSSVAEDIWWCTGTHPYRRTPETPIRGRLVAVDFIHGVGQIIQPLFKQLMPTSYLKGGSWYTGYSNENKTLTFYNESTLEFMSYEQETEKFAGTSRHFIHYDEEPPKHIFTECNARLVDTNGEWWISMTPVEGMTWIYEEVYEPGVSNRDSDILIVQADMLDNPHISPEAAEAYLQTLDPDERAAREHGTFVQLGGLVYKNFHRAVHVIPQVIPPKEWAWYLSLDHGYNNPTGVLWHAVSPDNQIITFGEHYASEMTIDEHAQIIKQKNAGFGKEPDFYVADPAIAQRSGITGTSIQTEYAMRDLYFALGNNDVDVGVAKVQMYLRVNPKTERPWRQITDNCVNFIWEMERLRWKRFASKKMIFENNPQEKIHKKNDHLCDADRYFHSFLPDLSPEEQGLIIPQHRANPMAPVYGTIDDVLAAMVTSQDNSIEKGWTTKYHTDLGGLEYD
jgi:phage terminase large subunit-like protein